MRPPDPENFPTDPPQPANAIHAPPSGIGARLRRWFKLRGKKLESNDGFKTHSFNDIPKPFPVEDVFVSARALIMLRLGCRGMVLLMVVYILQWALVFSSLMLPLTLLAALFQWRKIHGIGNMGIPTTKQLCLSTDILSGFG